MDDFGANYLGDLDNQNKASKATKMVILGNKFTLENVKYLCDYHYTELIESGAVIFSRSAILQESGIDIYCEQCKREER